MNARKTMVVAASFMVFPPSALSSELCWWTVATIRSSVLQSIVGGWPRVLTVILKSIFIGVQSVASKGICVQLRNGPTIVWPCLGALLSDNEGLQKGLGLKGHAGIKPCLRCFNVYARGKAPPGDEWVDITCADFEKLNFLTRAALDDCIELLRGASHCVQDGRMTKKRLAEIEKSLGLNFLEHSPLFDRQLAAELDFLDIIRSDWMHGQLSHGALAIEVESFLCAADDKLNLRCEFWKQFTDWRAGWHFPAFASHRAKRVYFQFNSYSERGKLHCNAADYLVIAAMLAHAAETRMVHTEMHLESLALQKAYYVTRVTQDLKYSKGHQLAAYLQELKVAMKEHFYARRNAYGDRFVPKHHYNWHTVQQARQDQRVLDMFFLERNHSMLKTAAEPICNTRTYEASLMSSATSHYFAALAEAGTPLLLGGVESIDSMVTKTGKRIATKDFVRSSTTGAIGKVAACFQVDGVLTTRVDIFEKLAETRLHCKCRASGISANWTAEDLLINTAWYYQDDTVVVCS